jgi:hypothetical protein
MRWFNKLGQPTQQFLDSTLYENIVNRQAARIVLDGATGQTPAALSSAMGDQAVSAQAARTALASETDLTAARSVINEAFTAARVGGTLPALSALGPIRQRGRRDLGHAGADRRWHQLLSGLRHTGAGSPSV